MDKNSKYIPDRRIIHIVIKKEKNMGQLIISGNSVYEVDENCYQKKKGQSIKKNHKKKVRNGYKEKTRK